MHVAHGQCIRYPTNALNPSTPHLERTEFPHCHPCSGSPSPLLPPARNVLFFTPAYPSAGRCVQFADVKCNIHLSPPSCPLPPPCATVCVQFMHLVRLRAFIDSCQSRVRGLARRHRGKSDNVRTLTEDWSVRVYAKSPPIRRTRKTCECSDVLRMTEHQFSPGKTVIYK